MKNKELKSYSCSIDKEHWETVNSFSPGMAKSKFWRDNRDYFA